MTCFETISGKSNSKKHARDYCTQACILGLTQNFLLDPHCPNNDAHRLHNPNRHILTRPDFLRCIRTQMARNLDTHVHDLRLAGSRGAMFRITLASHGYTVIGKGTTYLWITDLKHEEAIYTYVRPLQANSIPVCIGSINLEWYYRYSAFEELEFMMFMAYGGIPLYKYQQDGVLAGKSEGLPIEKIALQAREVMTELHQRAWRNGMWR